MPKLPDFGGAILVVDLELLNDWESSAIHHQGIDKVKALYLLGSVTPLGHCNAVVSKDKSIKALNLRMGYVPVSR